MKKEPSDRSVSNTGLVIGIAVLLLAIPCCGGLALVGAALVGFRSLERPRQPPVIVQPAPPQPPSALAPNEQASEVPAEASVPADAMNQ